jgi:hypothetical protein
LQCLIVITKTSDLHGPYPSFGLYYNQRTTPIISLLIRDKNVRNIFADINDKDLAKIIIGLDEYATKAYILFAGWHSGWWPPDIEQFLKANPIQDE